MIPLRERTVIADKYRLERELARGGMGAIWSARHLALDAPVALKFMSPDIAGSRSARARFAREARCAARLRGPHVVQVLDHGVDEDVPYIVMELLEGEHLGERLRRERRLSLPDAAAIAAQTACALDRAHRSGVVHRDLKPANIFLGREGDETTVTLLDFGIHKVMSPEDAEPTTAEALMGSPQYMSPEQARGSRRVDHRADLWSLGAILYRALTGVPAFDGVSAVDVIVHICTGPIPIASRAAPDLPAELDAFFQRALARDPEQRFATAPEMARALSALADKAVAPPLPPTSAPPAETPVPVGAPASSQRISVAEMDSFVERAFGALLRGEPSPSLGGDTLPTTTRCAAVRTFPPPSPARSSAPRVTARWAIQAMEASPSPSSVSSLIDQGFTALRRGEPDSARRAWEEALGLDPENRALALNLRRLSAGARRI